MFKEDLISCETFVSCEAFGCMHNWHTSTLIWYGSFDLAHSMSHIIYEYLGVATNVYNVTTIWLVCASIVPPNRDGYFDEKQKTTGK